MKLFQVNKTSKLLGEEEFIKPLQEKIPIIPIESEINEGTRKNKSRIGALFGAQNQMIATTREALERERNIRKTKKLDYDKMVEQMKEIHINDIFMSLKQLHALLKDNTGSHKKELQTILNKLRKTHRKLGNFSVRTFC